MVRYLLYIMFVDISKKIQMQVVRIAYLTDILQAEGVLMTYSDNDVFQYYQPYFVRDTSKAIFRPLLHDKIPPEYVTGLRGRLPYLMYRWC